MEQAPVPQRKREMPDGVWMKCPGCSETVFRKRVEDELMVCPGCQYHFPLSPDQRLNMLVDEGSFEEWDADMAPDDPLKFKDLQPYTERLIKHQNATGRRDAAVYGKGTVGGKNVVICVMDSRFIMASMGSVVGEKVTRGLEGAARLKTPFIAICASGGARMQEGMLSLMQMAKTSAAVGRFRSAGGLYIAVLTNPTTAGVMASFASLGDIIIAEPGAMIGFTGQRVIKETIKAELPESFQTSEFLLERGFLDMVVHRKNLKAQLVELMDYCPMKQPRRRK